MARSRKGSSGGVKGVISTVLIFFLLGGLVFAGAKAAGIRDAGDVLPVAKEKSQAVKACYEHTDYKPWECLFKDRREFVGNKEGSPGPGKSVSPAPSVESPSPVGGSKTKAPNDPNDSTSSSGSSDVDKLRKLTVKDPASVDYSRKEWRHWSGGRCSNTREKLLVKHGKNVRKDPSGCVVVSGGWYDNYSTETITDPKKIDIDHIVSLQYAAQHGGDAWSKEKKEQFANDVANLEVVSSKEDRSKGEDGPSKWMVPHNKQYRCEYSKKFVNVAYSYGLSVSEKDYNALEKTFLTACE